jgi:two-component system, chemotaxis family, protein-glutamate methylesterase/glutaminase
MADVKARKIRVLIVDDSVFMRKVLEKIIASDPQLEVAAQASDGHEAVALAAKLLPDVITMDINMPRMDGLEATRRIMAQSPRPIVIVSSESREGTKETLRALELGAIDFVSKPTSAIDLDMQSVSGELLRKLRMAAKVRVVRTASLGSLTQESAAAARPANRAQSYDTADSGFPLVVIAASTGGPAALMRLMPSFPKDFPAAVLLALHMPATFTAQLSEQLGGVTGLRVKEAEANEKIRPGTLLVCPGSHHMRVSAAGCIKLDDGPRINGYRPCADVTLESAAEFGGSRVIAVVLTGMGNDGAQGVQVVKKNQGRVIAQDESTSVVFGMPAEAIRTGAVDRVLATDEIYAVIEKYVERIMSVAHPLGVR